MKKIFFFAAAVVAAMTVNAKVISFADIVDNTDKDLAESTFDNAFAFTNIVIEGVANSDNSAFLVNVTQTEGTADWETTSLYLKDDDQVYFVFKDGSENKLVAKAYKEYIQPNGKAVCLVITGLAEGDKVTINLKKALNKETMIEGATVEKDMFNATAIELTAKDTEIRVYSKNIEGNADAKWQLISVEVPGEDSVDPKEAIDNIEAGEKAVKFFENGQLIIMKNGVKYNALGVAL